MDHLSCCSSSSSQFSSLPYAKSIGLRTIQKFRFICPAPPMVIHCKDNVLPASTRIRSKRKSGQLMRFTTISSVIASSTGSDAYSIQEANNREIAQDCTLDTVSAKGVDKKSGGTNNDAVKGIQKEEFMQKLKRYGVAGVLSYGLLNTVYYLGMFLFVWFYVAPSPGGLGYKAAAGRFIKILALVWAGSQITKLLRAGCALALAPCVDECLTWFTNHFKLQSRGKAFGAIVGASFGLALVIFVVITCLWA